MNSPVQPGKVIQRELDRGHFTTAAEPAASALRPLKLRTRIGFRRNREAISERLELRLEQSRDGGTYTPERARQLLAERRASHQ